jgi:CBS domain-containing membrane protein
MRLSTIMTRDVFHITPDASVDEAMELMDANDVRHLPVIDTASGSGRLVGLLSERDLLEGTGWLPERARELLEAPSGPIRKFMHAPVVTVSPQDSIVTACLRLVDWNIGCLPVLEDTELVGMLCDSDVLGTYVKACRDTSSPAASDPLVDEVMTVDMVTVEQDMPAEEALELCRRKNVRHLPVMASGDLVGLVSDRDLRLCLGRGQLEGTPIGQLAHGTPLTIPPRTPLSRVAEVLVKGRIGAVPVADGARMVGFVSAVDVLNHCMNVFAAAHPPATS